jgi:hypothetical protein
MNTTAEQVALLELAILAATWRQRAARASVRRFIAARSQRDCVELASDPTWYGSCN